MWPHYGIFLRLYRIMLRVAILRDMFLPLSARIIKVNTMNQNLSTDASPEPEGISLWRAKVLCFEHMNSFYIFTTFSLYQFLTFVIYTPALISSKYSSSQYGFKKLLAENLYFLYSEISSSLKCNADSITFQTIY